MTPMPHQIPEREITGMSAILLPFIDEHTADLHGLEAHVARTHEAGLIPAVNMDTGYTQILPTQVRTQVLEIAAAVTGGNFVAGVYAMDEPGSTFHLGSYLSQAHEIAELGGTPVIFPSYGLTTTDEVWLDGHRAIAGEVDRFIGFELGQMFVPYGRIASLETYAALMEIPQCVGAKHSSLQRQPEWERLRLRDELRPDFKVLTGNDLAIDMVMYGSDYLLGLSTFAPDLFARRDRLWADGDAGFHELNDVLQYLGHFTFRAPVPGYRHNAAMWLKLRGWIDSDAVPAGAPTRPASDRQVLRTLAEHMGVLA